MDDITYQPIERKTIYKGKRVDLEQVTYYTGDKIIKREHVLSPEAVVILALDDEKKVIMVKEMRTAIGKNILGLPAGLIEEKEEAKQAALRELEEETGYQAEEIKYLRSYYSSVGFTNEKLHLFLATQLTKRKQQLDEEEQIQVEKIPLEELKKMLDQKEIVTASALICLMHYFLYEN